MTYSLSVTLYTAIKVGLDSVSGNETAVPSNTTSYLLASVQNSAPEFLVWRESTPQRSSVSSWVVLRACRPAAWTGGFPVHQKTVYDWWRVIGVVEGSSRWQEQ